jgi:23S rRNA pseudouridine2605 synthase
MLEKMGKGVTVDGVTYGSVEASLENPLSRSGEAAASLSRARERGRERALNQWLTVALTEGKNREIRNIFEHFGCKVSRLIRLAYGPFQLGHLKPGEVKEVSAKVLESFIRL